MAKPFSPGLVLSGLLIATLLAMSAYYTYRTQTIRLTNPVPVTITTSTPATVTTTPQISCAIIDKTLQTTGKTKTFDILKLAPVDTDVYATIVPSDTGLMWFKHFNGGGPLYQDEKEKNEQYFAGQGPWYSTTIARFKGGNSSVVPTFNLPIEAIDYSSSIISVESGWYGLHAPPMGLGDGIYEQRFVKIVDNDITTIQVPKEYQPDIEQDCDPKWPECPASNVNNDAVVEIIGRTNDTLIFKTERNTSTLVSYNLNSDKWQKIPTGTGFTPRRTSIVEAIKTHGCLAMEWPIGTMVFTPHFLGEPITQLNIDIYWSDPNQPMYRWDRLK